MYNLLAAVISSLITLVGVIITCIVTSRSTRDNMLRKLEISQNNTSKQLEISQINMSNKFDVSQAVTDTKIDELTREVRLHNNFAQRVPIVEEQIKVANHRISDLENKNK